jgi:hypothetical protein
MVCFDGCFGIQHDLRIAALTRALAVVLLSCVVQYVASCSDCLPADALLPSDGVQWLGTVLHIPGRGLWQSATEGIQSFL